MRLSIGELERLGPVRMLVQETAQIGRIRRFVRDRQKHVFESRIAPVFARRRIEVDTLAPARTHGNPGAGGGSEPESESHPRDARLSQRFTMTQGLARKMDVGSSRLCHPQPLRRPKDEVAFA